MYFILFGARYFCNFINTLELCSGGMCEGLGNHWILLSLALSFVMWDQG